MPEEEKGVEGVLRKNLVPIVLALFSLLLTLGGIYYEFKDMKKDQVAQEAAHKAAMEAMELQILNLVKKHEDEMKEVRMQLWGELEQRTDDMEEYLAWLAGKEGRPKP
jgi:sensor histidine kinase regulating citrate/malate metabolism